MSSTANAVSGDVIATHPTVLPPDVEGSKIQTNANPHDAAGHDAGQVGSDENTHLKSKESHELCHHVHHSDRYAMPHRKWRWWISRACCTGRHG